MVLRFLSLDRDFVARRVDFFDRAVERVLPRLAATFLLRGGFAFPRFADFLVAPRLAGFLVAPRFAGLALDLAGGFDLGAALVGLPALLPAIAPTIPPTTALTGPITLPRTAPVAAPAASLEIEGN